MGNSTVHSTKNMNRPYERFLSFVFVTVIFRMIPFIISVTPNEMILRMSIGVVLFIAFVLFDQWNAKPAARLREFCNSLNITTVTLYTVYIVIYFSIYFLFNK